MSEERLKEIKDSIELQKNITMIRNYDRTFINEEIELYNEVVRLRKIIDEAEDKLYCWGETLNADFQKEMLDILKQNNLTLEQLTGVENE